jgi:hypothetical protein
MTERREIDIEGLFVEVAYIQQDVGRQLGPVR